ncbi:MAG TPA: hypothetical protein VJ783_25930 [Pirellulales bacterium]|nr:hypothetical protein [Pirellulales bacterium]
MIANQAADCLYSRWPLRLLALLVACAVLGLAGSEARAGMMLPEELAAPSSGPGCIGSDADSIASGADSDASPKRESVPQNATPTLADQPASPPSGASGAGSSLTSGGPTLAVVLSASVSSGSLEPNGACLERANAALPMPPTFDFLRPPCRLA